MLWPSHCDADFCQHHADSLNHRGMSFGSAAPNAFSFGGTTSTPFSSAAGNMSTFGAAPGVSSALGATPSSIQTSHGASPGATSSAAPPNDQGFTGDTTFSSLPQYMQLRVWELHKLVRQHREYADSLNKFTTPSYSLDRFTKVRQNQDVGDRREKCKRDKQSFDYNRSCLEKHF